jgi:ribosomal protein S18 acetylase RimI-like enzyme
MTSVTALRLLARLESSMNETLLKTQEWRRIGPFRAYFDSLSELIWLNYATPVATLDNQRNIRIAITDLRAEFSRRHRRLRFEFIEPLWPELAAILQRQGLVLQARQSLMICTLAGLIPRQSRELRIHELGADSDDAALAAFLRVSAEAFADGGIPPPGSLQSVQRLRVELQCGARRAVMGFVGDEPAGVAALCPMGSVAELVGVATLPRFRRGGVATILSTRLAAEFLRGGGEAVWLSANDATAQTAYRAIGFSDAGVYANYIDPPTTV